MTRRNPSPMAASGLSTLIWFFVLLGQSAIANAADEDAFNVVYVGQQTVEGENSIAITFNRKLDESQDFSELAEIKTHNGDKPQGAWRLSEDNNQLFFTNVESATRYAIKVFGDLRDEDNNRLDGNRTFDVTTRKVVPSVSFDTQGFILAKDLTKGIPINSLNIDKVDVDFFRVKDGKIASFLSTFNSQDTLRYYNTEALHQVSDFVYSGRWDVNTKRNVRVAANLPIKQVAPLNQAGVYVAILRGAGHYQYSHSMTWFSISDIGLHARFYQDEFHVFAQSFEKGRSLSGVQYKVYSYHNEILAEGESDAEGSVVFNTHLKNKRYLVAQKDDSLSILQLNAPALDLSELTNIYTVARPIELFTYGPRDIYRPGETLVIDGLLRDLDGELVAMAGLKGTIRQPDGKVAHNFTWRGENLNHYHLDYAISPNAITGQWRVEFELAGSQLEPFEFTVADFLPERMKLTLGDGSTEPMVQGMAEDLLIPVDGQFLYGAPAADHKVDGQVTLSMLRNPVADTFPGFQFGNILDNVNRSYNTHSINLDANGKGHLFVDNQWQNAKSPVRVVANVSLYESGGRPVTRAQEVHAWPADALVGIRAKLDDDHAEYDTNVEYEVLLTNQQGELLGHDNLQARVIREYRDYYWEYSDSGDWHIRYNTQTYPVASFKLAIKEGEKGSLRFPVKWGGYRLEVVNPDTGLTTSHRIWAGWRWEDQYGDTNNYGGARPDRVEILLDKPAYRIGEVANVTVKAPEGGKGYLFVEADTNLMTLPIDVPKDGASIELSLEEEWLRHDLYLSAIVVKPGDEAKGLTPKRAIGLRHLPLDRSHRELKLAIEAPAKTEPNQKVSVSVQSESVLNGEAWVTLAAVDVGVLALTNFETPDPFEFMFRPRRYLPDMRDLYQDLIETNDGEQSRQRFGGDAPLARGGEKPQTDVRIVALYKQAVKFDDKGQAQFDLDLPDFNGRLRLMAVAHTANQFGASDHEMTLVSPIVAEIAMPRFMAFGDQSTIALDVQNMSGETQKMQVSLTTTDPIMLLGQSQQEITLTDKQKQTFRFDVRAKSQFGQGDVTVSVSGVTIDGEPKSLTRSWFLATRPAYPAITDQVQTIIDPAQSVTLKGERTDQLLVDTLQGSLALASQPPINVGDHIAQLNVYPYGCLEQTTSGIFPHALLSPKDLARLGVRTKSEEARLEKVQIGINRLWQKQKANGGFGLWSSNSPEEHWLTAYATHFLVMARDAGFDVDDAKLNRALDRLNQYVRRPNLVSPRYGGNRDHYRLASRAYAAFILATQNRAPLGDVRIMFDRQAGDAKGPLPLVQIATALHLLGDNKRAEQALEKSRTVTRNQRYYGDYGSPLRDQAMAVWILTEHWANASQRAKFIFDLAETVKSERWFSTQERNALVLAGSSVLLNAGEQWQALVTVAGEDRSFSDNRLINLRIEDEEVAEAITIRNTGGSPLYVDLTTSGYGKTAPEESSNQLAITRKYYTLDGEPLEPHTVQSGDLIVTELQVSSDTRMPDTLVVDLLPAGFELEDPNLANSVKLDDIKIGEKTIKQWHSQINFRHQEFRDDRYVAAIDSRRNREQRLFYLARVVTPGQYLVPNPLVEDMYRPYIRGVGKTLDLIRVNP